MSEDYAPREIRYSEAELARAYREIEPILPDYTVEQLHRACIQAQKNRLWDEATGK